MEPVASCGWLCDRLPADPQPYPTLPMSRLAHVTFAAPGFEAEKRALARQAQLEVQQAKQIQARTGCTWTQALKEACEGRAEALTPEAADAAS